MLGAAGAGQPGRKRLPRRDPARQAGISIDIGVGGIAVAGSYFAALPVLGRLQRERKQRALAHKAPAPGAVPEPKAGYSST